jgi:tight adherence protein E
MASPVPLCKRIHARRSKGVASIEFVLGFMAFWWICMAWIEMSYMSYISALSDYAVSDAARLSKLTSQTQCDGDESCQETQFLNVFKTALHNQSSLWAHFIDPAKFTFSIQYVTDENALENLTDDYCPVKKDQTYSECGTAADSAIAIYRINYPYTPMFNFFLKGEQLFSREVIVIQEYERDKFDFQTTG